MLLAFKSTREVMAAEKRINAARIPCQLIPLPRSVSVECGMGIRIDARHEQVIRLLLDKIEIKSYEE